MLIFLLIILVCALAFIFVSAIVTGVRQGRSSGNGSPTVYRSKSSSVNPIEQTILRMMCDDFRSLGWTQWDNSVHSHPGQLDRIRRAATDKRIYTIECNKASKSALITSAKEGAYHVSGTGCSCPDFQYRRLPCKHMYCLAMELTSE